MTVYVCLYPPDMVRNITITKGKIILQKVLFHIIKDFLITRATKTEEPSQKKVKKNNTESEKKIKKISDNMDQKVLNKRKLEEEKESNWQKERQKGETLKLEKTKESKISRKIFAGESQKTISNQREI